MDSDSSEYERMTGKALHYDRQGKPIHWEAWALEFEFIERHVAASTLTIARKPIDISTVWLGLDHGFGMTPKPLIFETMVFGGPLDGYQRRYATEEEARAGHDEIVAFHNRVQNRLRFRIYGAVRFVLEVGSGTMRGIRRPASMKNAWIFVSTWTVALLSAAFALVANFLADDFTWTWSNLFWLTVDGYMLINAGEGFRWRRMMDKEHPPPKRERGRRKSK